MMYCFENLGYKTRSFTYKGFYHRWSEPTFFGVFLLMSTPKPLPKDLESFGQESHDYYLSYI